MTRNELIEKMAEAIFDAGYEAGSRTQAIDALSTIEAAGFAIVPVEPTEKMLSAMARSNSDWLSDRGPYPRSRRVYRAMLAAAKEEQE